MEENRRMTEDTIDLLDLARKLLKYWWLLLLSGIIGAVAAGTYSVFMITPLYKAECMMYVNNGAISVGSTTVSLQDLNASQSLVDTYMVILKSRRVLMEVADEAGVDYSYEKMKNMVSASKVSDTEVFSIFVTSPDPEEAEHIANTITEVLPDKISDIVEGSSVKIVDYAVVPSQKISPSNSKNTLMGGMAFFVLVGGVLVLLILTDNSIQSDMDIFQITKYPILSKIPDQALKASGAPYRKGKLLKRNKHSKKKKVYDSSGKPVYIGDNLAFHVMEAYRLLRTNIIYSLPHSERGKLIGITSSVAAEYKTTTAINLAMSLSKHEDKKVLLLDCDLRMSEVSDRLKLDNHLGMTEYLTGDVDLYSTIQKVNGFPNLSIIAGGNTSPNPGELLCSKKMKRCLKELAEEFDYVIADFPPANIVSDALHLGKECDGMVMLIRQNYTEKTAAEEALRKLKFLSINVLGIVVTGVVEGSHGKSYYYKKYYGNYRNAEAEIAVETDEETIQKED